MAFSGALTITDLDDFLTPSQACIIPVRQTNKPASQADGRDPNTEIQIDANNNYYEVSTYSTALAGPSSEPSKKALEKAEINLNDCLACSGCITSTESMLITLQSHNEVLEFISASSSSPTRTPVLSISPQTLASLSAAYSSSTGRPTLALRTLLWRIRHHLSDESRGGWRVWDTTFSRHLSLHETVMEFDERRAKAKGKEVVREGVPPAGPMPVLASACPGWVCYAEKAQGDLLPLLSGVRSSQAIMGGLVKQWWAGRMGLKPNEIYHVTAMPCYDKKLEASRSDFYSSLYATRDVDCVLTTGELDLLLQDLAFDPYMSTPLDDVEPSNDPAAFGSPWPELLQHQGSSSGSYLHTIIRHLGDRHHGPTRVITRELRGSTDNVEYLLVDSRTNEVLFKGAKCYGFRNLQNLVRKVGKETGMTKSRGGTRLSAAVAARRRKARTGAGEVATPTTDGSDAESLSLGAGGAAAAVLAGEDRKLEFVEVMACPGGCVNGGGQMKPPKKDEEGYERPIEVEGVEAPGANGVDEGMRWSTKEWVAKVEAVYWSGLPTPPPSPGREVSKASAGEEEVEAQREKKADALAERVVEDACGGDAGKRWEFLRTRFRKVEGDILNGGVTHEAVKW